MQKSTNSLRQLRITAGLTMDELSVKTGVPRSSIGAFEKGTRPLKPKHRHALEKFFNAEIVEISTPDCSFVDEAPTEYRDGGSVFSKIPSDQLEVLLQNCAKEKDWLAVEKVAAELANRKMKERLK
jgi:transcriptional regulator with XRE-family HTH domain